MVQRRDVLRWAAVSGAALAFGCRPSPPTDDVDATQSPSAIPERPPTPADSDDAAAGGDTLRQPTREAERAAETNLDPPPDHPPERPPAPQSDASEGEARRLEPPDTDESADTSDANLLAHPVQVLCREALGLAPARSEHRVHELSRLTLHHTAVALSVNALAPSRLRGHQRYQMEQGWSDIAYHFAVDLAGNIYELRAVEAPGDTFTDYDPAGHFLVVCEGNFDQQAPTDAMLTATAEILAYGAITYGPPSDSLSGHRDHAATTCPGDALQERLGDLRGEVVRLAATGVRRLDQCGAGGRDLVAAIEAG